MFSNCTLCQKSWFQYLAFIAAVVCLLFAIKFSVEGLVE